METYPFQNARPVDKAHPWIDAKCEELQNKAHLGDKSADKDLEERLTENYETYAERHKQKMKHAKLPPIHGGNTKNKRPTNR